VFSTSNELVVPQSRSKLVALAAGSGAFVVMGAWMLSMVREEGVFIGAIGLASVAFFGACGVSVLSRLVRSTPALVIDHRGIVDDASGVSVGLIRWDEIEELREYLFQGQVWLGIVPRDLDAVLARQPAWKRRIIRRNLRLGAAPVNVPQAMLPMKVADLLREIDVRFPHGRVRDTRLEPASDADASS
jgi:hypothetical protein